MQGFVKYIASKTCQPLLVRYLSSTRFYSRNGIRLEIPPTVFHPGFFHSTKLLLRYLSKQHLYERSFLELGAGSGLLSMYAAKNRATVTAIDINREAIRFLQKNSDSNGVQLKIIHSDLFASVAAQCFDIIVINPPYYKKAPQSERDHAWYCGEKGEFFQELFAQLNNYMHPASLVLMVLCDGCDLTMIHEYAKSHSFSLKKIITQRSLIETNYIFKIEKV